MGRLAHRPGFGIRRVRAALAAAVVLAVPGVAGGAPADGCALAEGPVTVVAVDEAGDLVVEDGRVLHLAGLDVPEGYEASVRGWLDGLAGHAIVFATVSGRDRWGRIGVLARPLVAPVDPPLLPPLLPPRAPAAAGPVPPAPPAPEGAGVLPPRLDMALIEAGTARRRAGAELPEACLAGAVRAEARARAAQAGLWADEAHRAVEAADTALLLGRAGRLAVVEGRVFSVGVRAERTYINFGRRWSDDTTVTIPKRIWRKVEARGMSADALRGRRIRVRGIVEARDGPYVEVSAPDEIEFIETDQAR